MKLRLLRPILILLLGGAPALAAGGKIPVDLVQATIETPEARLLDVGIEVFEPGVPEGDEDALEEKGIYADVRRSEARYIPFHLKATLQSTGFWGAVRVVPQDTRALELRVRGEILDSDGRRLAVRVSVEDASGKRWFERRYADVASPGAYSGSGVEVEEPHQDLYNAIANDLHQQWSRLDADEVQELRTIARLQFAQSLAPELFGDYLEVNRRGRVDIGRLPAENDPLFARVQRIRDRDYMFIDTLNEHYANFYRSMESSYDEWRSFSYDERMALREVRREARTRAIIGALSILGGAVVGGPVGDVAVIGGAYGLESGISMHKETRIHAEALRELAASFNAEIEPVLVDVEGETIRLSGAAEEQFRDWRELLRRIFEDETGLPVDPNVTATEAAGAEQ